MRRLSRDHARSPGRPTAVKRCALCRDRFGSTGKVESSENAYQEVQFVALPNELQFVVTGGL